MFKHADIWNAIDRLAQSNGYSASGLAKKAGLDPTTFNKSKRISADGKPRWPSTESLSKILAVTGATMTELIALMDSDTAAQTRKINKGNLNEAGIRTGDVVAFKRSKDGEIITAELLDINKSTIEIRTLEVPYENNSINKKDIDFIARLVWMKS